MTFLLLALTVAADTEPVVPEIDFSALFLKMVALLVVIVILGFVLVRYLSPAHRWRSKGKKSANFELIESFRLEPKKTIYIVRLGKRFFALGSGESQLELLTEFKEDDLT